MIWKDSEASYLLSGISPTFHVAVDWPGLKWTCLGAVPLKSSLSFVVSSLVSMPDKGQETQCKSEGIFSLQSGFYC